jgi:hypothetical protein
VRLRILSSALLLMAFASGQTPPAASPNAEAKKEYLERRAVILRQMAEIRAQLASLELDLQLLEESRPEAVPPPVSWRENVAVPDAPAPVVVKKTPPRCLQVTRDGKRCTRTAESGGKYCWQHRNH